MNGKKSNFFVPICINPFSSCHFLNTLFSSKIPMFIFLHTTFLLSDKHLQADLPLYVYDDIEEEHTGYSVHIGYDPAIPTNNTR